MTTVGDSELPAAAAIAVQPTGSVGGAGDAGIWFGKTCRFCRNVVAGYASTTVYR